MSEKIAYEFTYATHQVLLLVNISHQKVISESTSSNITNHYEGAG